MNLLETRTAVYRCYDADDRLLYVGMSIDPHGRLECHRTQSSWYPRMVRSTFEWFPDRATARAEELRVMRAESSLHNREGLTMPTRALPGPDGTRWAAEAIRLRRQKWTIKAIAAHLGTSSGRVRSVLRLHHLAGVGWRYRRPML